MLHITGNIREANLLISSLNALYASHFASPESDLLLLKVSSLFLVDEHEVEEVAALESVVYIWISWR